jgi:hypothetical protein
LTSSPPRAARIPTAEAAWPLASVGSSHNRLTSAEESEEASLPACPAVGSCERTQHSIGRRAKTRRKYRLTPASSPELDASKRGHLRFGPDRKRAEPVSTAQGLNACRFRGWCRCSDGSEQMRHELLGETVRAPVGLGLGLQARISAQQSGQARRPQPYRPRPCRRHRVFRGCGNARWFGQSWVDGTLGWSLGRALVKSTGGSCIHIQSSFRTLAHLMVGWPGLALGGQRLSLAVSSYPERGLYTYSFRMRCEGHPHRWQGAGARESSAVARPSEKSCSRTSWYFWEGNPCAAQMQVVPIVVDQFERSLSRTFLEGKRPFLLRPSDGRPMRCTRGTHTRAVVPCTFMRGAQAILVALVLAFLPLILLAQTSAPPACEGMCCLRHSAGRSHAGQMFCHRSAGHACECGIQSRSIRLDLGLLNPLVPTRLSSLLTLAKPSISRTAVREDSERAIHGFLPDRFEPPRS